MNLIEESPNLSVQNDTSNYATSNEEGNRIMELINAHPVLKSFLTGAFSGTCSTFLFQPLDLLKTRIQNPTGFRPGINNLGMVSVAMQVVKNEKLVGLWKGTAPSIARSVPGIAIYFSSLHMLQVSSNINNPGPLEAVCLGICARSFAGATLLPFTVVKTRYESGIYAYKSVAGALKDLYKTEGTRGLFSGLIPTLFRDAPFSGLYLLFYTQSKRILHVHNGDNNAKFLPYFNFLCGLIAGALASAITQPADVIKTRMQLYPKKYSHLRTVTATIYKEQGPSGFFSGLMPRLVRRTLMSAMAWTIYEQVMRGVGFR